jgi:hypothetical protein
MCFHLFPLLPTEIRLQIWTAAFPESRRIRPVRRPNILANGRPSAFRRNKHFNWANTDPVALWVNHESRELALKYYPARDAALLKHLEERDNVRYPAHIDFANDIILFPNESLFGEFVGRIRGEIDDEAPCAFLSRRELASVTHLELRFSYDDLLEMENILTYFLNESISLFSNVQDIFVDITFGGTAGGIWEENVETEETAPILHSISAEIHEARDLGKGILDRFQTRVQGEGGSWKMPLLDIVPERGLGMIDELRELVEDFYF